jgi:hypothetical protein
MAVERCPTCKRRMKRSNEANRRYWLLLHTISDKLRPQNVQHSPEVWHCYFKSRFMGHDDVRLPNGKVLSIVRSTTDLDVPEFADYMTQVEVWANEHDVYLADMEMV